MNSTRTRTRIPAGRARRMAYLRGKLLERRRMLLDNVSAQITEVQEPIAPGDTADMASTIIAQEDTYRAGAVGSDAVAQIDYALHRLESGKYGICEDCGKPIPEARLKVVPFAYLCVACKDREEREDRVRDEGLGGLDDLSEIPTDEGTADESPTAPEFIRGRRPSD